MTKQKYFYYVGVITPDGVRFATNIDNKTRTALWSKDGKPKSFTKAIADDIVYGLCMNFHIAFTARFLFELEAQPDNCFTEVRL